MSRVSEAGCALFAAELLAFPMIGRRVAEAFRAFLVV